MITAMILCAHLTAAHAAHACAVGSLPKTATFLTAEGRKGVLLYSPGDAAERVDGLRAAGADVTFAEWADTAVVMHGAPPAAVIQWVQALDAGVEYTALTAQDTRHWNDAKTAGDLLRQAEWGERMNRDAASLREIKAQYSKTSGLPFPAMPAKTVEE